MKTLMNDFWNEYWNLAYDKQIKTSRIIEDDNGLKIEIDVPGYDKKDIDISIKNNKLQVRGDILDREFEKIWSINNNVVDIKNITASVKKGILKIYIPYKSPPDETYKIQIE